MIIDTRNIDSDKVVQADICIVGAGPAGITIARELMGSKLKVALIESGGFKLDDEAQKLNTGHNIGLPYFDLDGSRARGFGGSSHRWHVDIGNNSEGVRLRALDKIDFEERDWIPNSGWPFKKEDLDAYYKRAHEVFKIGPYCYDVDKWQDPKSDGAFLSYSERIQTTVFQFAHKNVFYEDYLAEIKHAENIAVYPNTTVLEIATSENVKEVSYARAKTLYGTELKVEATRFILASGGLEIPRLLLLSNNDMKCGLGNQHDLVGRFFMEHPHLWSGFWYPSEQQKLHSFSLYKTHDVNGVPVQGKFTIAEEVLRENKMLNFGASVHSVNVYEKKMEKAVHSFKILGVAAKKGRMADNFGRHFKNVFTNIDAAAYMGITKIMGSDKEKQGFYFNIMAEQIPDPESRVTLGSERDKYGQNKINLNWKLNAADVKSIRKAQQIFTEEIEKLNLGRFETDLHSNEPPPFVHGGRHHMGTTRMHKDPKKGVVNKNGRVHGINNLYIAGSSLFPTVGFANPTLTIVALALRLSDHIKLISKN